MTGDFWIGRETVTNATMDFLNPYSVVNEIGCTNCDYYYAAGNVTETFATYNPDNSAHYMPVSGPNDVLYIPVVYQPEYGYANVGGSWASDKWYNTMDVNNPVRGDLTFWLATSYPSVLSTWGTAEVIGLGYNGAPISGYPSNTSFMQAAFDQG